MRIPQPVAKPHAAAGNHRLLLSLGEDPGDRLPRVAIHARSAVRRSDAGFFQAHRLAVDRCRAGNYGADVRKCESDQLATLLVAARLVGPLRGVAWVDGSYDPDVHLPNN